MEWQDPADVPEENLLPDVPDTLKPLLVESLGTDETSKTIEGEVRGFDAESMAGTLDAVLGTLTSKAALSEAVLETRAVWAAPPLVMREGLVCGIARELWGAGFRVTFGASWEPVIGADLVIGTGGSDGDLEDFLQEGRSWEISPRHP